VPLTLKSGEPQTEQISRRLFLFIEVSGETFRTKKNRDLELKTPFRKIEGKKKIAIKVVDIFGNDTTKVIEVTV